MEVPVRRLSAILVVSVCATACGIEYPAPEVTQVSPGRGWNGEDTLIDIHGRNFYPKVWVEAGNRARLDDGYSALLVSREGLEFDLASTVESYEQMDAVVPLGLTPGLYDVVVEAPNGRRGVLEGAYTVSSTVADRIQLGVLENNGIVDELLTVDVWLANPLGQRVHEEGFGIEFWLEDVEDQPYPGGVFVGHDILGASVTSDGRYSGILGSEASLEVAVPDPGVYTLHAEPQRDDGVRDDFTSLEWTAGERDGVRIDLPSGSFQARVGVPFDVQLTWVDENDIPLLDEQGLVLLLSDCAGLLDLSGYQVNGSETVQLTLDTPCELDWLTDILTGSTSDSFEVLPAPPDHFAVLALDGVAGVSQDFQVVAMDGFGNAVDWNGTVDLALNNGALESVACTQSSFDGSRYDCVGTPTVAGSSIVVIASDSSGTLSGTSNPFEVVPNDGSIGSLDIQLTTLALAGEPTGVTVEPVDSWGNAVDASFFGPFDWAMTDDLGEAVCAFTGLAGALAEFECTQFTARPGAVLTAELLSQSVQSDSAPYEVFNGPIDRVDVLVPGGPAITAGVDFTVEFLAFDAYDNPAGLLADSTLELSDDTGTFDPTSGNLDSSGVLLTTTATLTRAGNTVIRASQAGVELGVSELLTVSPGSTTNLAVTVDAPWAWIGVPEDVRVEAVDDYGNRTAWTGSVDLISLSTLSPDALVSVTNGVGTVAYTWTEWALDDQLEASSASWTGTSALIDIAEDCPGTGPTAAMDFGNGNRDAVACYTAGTAISTVSFAGSVPGAGTLVRYDIAVVDGERVLSDTPNPSFDLGGVGVFDLQGLVIDDLGCGDETQAMGYAGPDDGQAVGPIELTAGATNIDALVGSTTIDVVDATDCSRDPASFASIRVRTALGDLLGTSPTGSGLEVITDVNGDATFTLDAANTPNGGQADVLAWVESGAGFGSTSVVIDDDNLRPVVWSQTPSGVALGLVSSIDVTLSEPVQAGSLNPTDFDLVGPAPVAIDTVSLSPDERTITVDLVSPADGSLGAWTLTVPDVVRDIAGNRLSGDWSGNRADYMGTFGAVAATVDPVSCLSTTPASATFRPDGDDGIGIEADFLSIAVSSVVAPAWWEIAIEPTGSGSPLLVDRVVPVGASDAIEWDGRDGEGRIVDNGSFDVTITPVDGVGNRGTGCTVATQVNNSGVP